MQVTTWLSFLIKCLRLKSSSLYCSLTVTKLWVILVASLFSKCCYFSSTSIFKTGYNLSVWGQFKMTKDSCLQVTLENGWQPHHSVKQSRSERLLCRTGCARQCFLHWIKTRKNVCWTFLPHPDFTYIWKVLILIPALFTPTSLFPEINTMMHVWRRTCTCEDSAAHSYSFLSV